MPVLLGNDTISYPKRDGTTGVYLLRVPFQTVEPAKRNRRYVSESVDYVNREVIRVGEGVSEIKAVITYADEPATLLEMLQSGADGNQLIVTRDGISYPSMLIEPSGDLIELAREARANPYKEFTVEVVLRHATGGSYFALI